VTRYAVIDPADGSTVREYPTATDDEARQAVAAADLAHREWARTSSIAERAALLRRVGDLHLQKRQDLAGIIVRETGKAH
jgi:succinate-semialdehyde dehydrogenase/glutarate-semialdehyde dehydrogenase